MKSERKLRGSPFLHSIVAGTIVCLGIIGLRLTGSLESLELAAYDWNIRLQPKKSLEVSPGQSQIVLVAVDEEDIRRYGWPLTDRKLAQVLETLTRYRPRAIGLDIFRDAPIPPGSDELEEILIENPHIITVMKFGDDEKTRIGPPSVLDGGDRVGFNDILVDRGGIVRRGLLFLDDGKVTVYSFALRLAGLYLEQEGIVPQPSPSNSQYIQLGRTTIPFFEGNDGGYVNADERGYQFLIDYSGGRAPFSSFSLATLLAGDVDPENVSGKIVLLGVIAEGVKDYFYTPHSRGLYAGQQVSGITLHALITRQLVRFGLDGAQPIKTASGPAEGLWILLWSLMGSVLGFRVRSPWRFLLLASGGLLVLGLVVYLAFLREWWIPFVPPAFGWVISASLVTAYMANRERRERIAVMNLFAKHVSPEIAEVIWQQRDRFMDGGRPRPQHVTATVMFTDLKGFTARSEKMNLQDLTDWLNTYLEAMAGLVIMHGGVILEYTGDGLMAAFGVPLARTTGEEISRDASNAVNCSLAMESEMIRLNALWQERRLSPMTMRVGIFTGPVVACTVGSTQRLKYTAIGDTVNTASRLESFDKDNFDPVFADTPCRILIGDATLEHLGDRFRTEKAGEVSLRGKEQAVTAFRLIGRKNP